MSAQVLLGVGALVAAAASWAVGTAGLTRTSALQAFPHSRGGGWGRYVLTYAVTLVLVLVGVFTLADQVGGWALLGLVAVFLPQGLLTVVRRRRAGRRADAGGRR